MEIVELVMAALSTRMIVRLLSMHICTGMKETCLDMGLIFHAIQLRSKFKKV